MAGLEHGLKLAWKQQCLWFTCHLRVVYNACLECGLKLAWKQQLLWFTHGVHMLMHHLYGLPGICLEISLETTTFMVYTWCTCHVHVVYTLFLLFTQV